MSVTGLAYVALAVRDVEATASVFERQFKLGRGEVQTPQGRAAPLFGVGDSALVLFASDDPFLGPFLGDGATPGVDHIAMAIAEPEELAEPEQLADRLAIAQGDTLAGPGLGGTRELRLDAAATCGVRTRFCQSLEPVSSGGDLIQRIDHVGVASADNGAATDFFASKLGLNVESTQTDVEVHTAIESFTSDRYGVVYHNRPPRVVGGLQVTFITIGDCELELLQPLAPSGVGEAGNALGSGPGNTGGDNSAIGRYMEKHGPGLHHLALKTADIDAALAALSQQGLSMIDARGRPGSRRARIGFVHPRSLSGLLLHLVERDVV
jgi:methylmalonyl-CoA/ethylmalonyl-CoA epimerase